MYTASSNQHCKQRSTIQYHADRVYARVLFTIINAVRGVCCTCALSDTQYIFMHILCVTVNVLVCSVILARPGTSNTTYYASGAECISPHSMAVWCTHARRIATDDIISRRRRMPFGISIARRAPCIRAPAVEAGRA